MPKKQSRSKERGSHTGICDAFPFSPTVLRLNNRLPPFKREQERHFFSARVAALLSNSTPFSKQQERATLKPNGITRRERHPHPATRLTSATSAQVKPSSFYAVVKQWHLESWGRLGRWGGGGGRGAGEVMERVKSNGKRWCCRGSPLRAEDGAVRGRRCWGAGCPPARPPCRGTPGKTRG